MSGAPAILPQAAASRLVLLRQRGFGLYLGARFVSTVGIQVMSVAVGWHVYDIERSPLALGYVGLAQFLPMIVMTLPAGDLADRIERRRIIVTSYALQAAAAGILLALALAGSREVGAFYAALVLFGLARALAGPATQSIVPLLVARADLPTAIAWSSSVFQVAVIAGPALGGAVYLLGPVAAYGVCLALFLAVALAFLGVRARRPEADTGPVLGAWRRVLAGIGYVRSRRVILGAISLDLFAVLLGGATALLPIYARDILEVGPTGLGLLRSAPAVGAAAMAIFLARRPLARHGGVTMFACVAVFGVATVVFGLSENFFVSLGALAVLGMTDMVSVYVRHMLIQLATPDAMRGRVSAVNILFIGASNELGEFESGLTAHWFGTVPAVVLGGLGTLAVVAVWLWRFPELRRVDRLAEVTPENA